METFLEAVLTSFELNRNCCRQPPLTLKQHDAEDDCKRMRRPRQPGTASGVISGSLKVVVVVQGLRSP